MPASAGFFDQRHDFLLQGRFFLAGSPIEGIQHHRLVNSKHNCVLVDHHSIRGLLLTGVLDLEKLVVAFLDDFEEFAFFLGKLLNLGLELGYVEGPLGDDRSLGVGADRREAASVMRVRSLSGSKPKASRVFFTFSSLCSSSLIWAAPCF